MGTTIVDYRFDYKGFKCPMPIFKLGKEIGNVQSGQLIEALADDPAFKPDVEAFCRLRKHELIGVEIEGTVIRATIRKS